MALFDTVTVESFVWAHGWWFKYESNICKMQTTTGDQLLTLTWNESIVKIETES